MPVSQLLGRQSLEDPGARPVWANIRRSYLKNNIKI
jgi:hypothetical protein